MSSASSACNDEHIRYTTSSSIDATHVSSQPCLVCCSHVDKSATTSPAVHLHVTKLQQVTAIGNAAVELSQNNLLAELHCNGLLVPNRIRQFDME